MTQTAAQPAEREVLPVHPHTRPLAGWIEAIASWYNNAFGTPAAFAISLIALAGWIALIPILGFSKWNSGPGLLGNTAESTGEWFFGLAVLIVGVSSAARQKDIKSNQHHQMDSIQEMLASIAAQEQQIRDVEDSLQREMAANTDLTRQVHELATTIAAQTAVLDEIHRHVEALAPQAGMFRPPGGAP